MEKWILVVGYDSQHLELARKDWANLNVTLDAVDTATEAIEQFPKWQYSAVIQGQRLFRQEHRPPEVSRVSTRH